MRKMQHSNFGEEVLVLAGKNWVFLIFELGHVRNNSAGEAMHPLKPFIGH